MQIYRAKGVPTCESFFRNVEFPTFYGFDYTVKSHYFAYFFFENIKNRAF